jgi:hypothetical protein
MSEENDGVRIDGDVNGGGGSGDGGEPLALSGNDGRKATVICRTKGNALDTKDCIMSAGVLFAVVVSAVARFHAGQCRKEIYGAETDFNPSESLACKHPAVYLLWDHLAEWMGNVASAAKVMSFTLAFPLTICLAVTLYNGGHAVSAGGWRIKDVAFYQVMGIFTGAMAGLVGIGGGLIFSPFFIIMGIEPAVAVATSSTCVIFTSSSTTLQYLFTDRIIMSLAVVYGFVNLVASYGGTVFVHYLTDTFAGRRSYVTGIVAVGVGMSALLSLLKLA